MFEPESKFIVVSNAEPYKHVKGEGKRPICKEVGGGLTTAMNPQMKRSGGTWIAYGRGERDFEVLDSRNKIQVPDFSDVPAEEKYWLQRLDFPTDQYENFYRGYANRILWPIFHSFPTKANMAKERQYWNKGYLPCNKKYAKAVIENYEEGDTIWIHDYHLALVPRLVRNEIPEAKIGVFWHIPWPPWENFLKIPHRREILLGLAGADLIGLHIGEYVENLVRCARECGAQIDEDSATFRLEGEKSKVAAYPLGVDFQFFNETDTGGEERRIRSEYKAENLVLGVDRQDYTKGIPERIAGFKDFIERNPSYRGQVSLIQRTPESRSGIEEYQLEKETINQEVAEFNGKFESHDWEPITLFWHGVPQKDLIAEYRAADIGLVTPGLDGMNLVAKEFVAANSEPKVLILSEFAGSSEQLEEALLVNPYDGREIAEAIKRALEMPEDEKKSRWKALRNKVRSEDLPTWAKNFLKDLNKNHKLFRSSKEGNQRPLLN